MSSTTNYEQLAQAAEWFAVLSDDAVSEAERDAWRRWLNQSDENRQAWQEVESISGLFSSLNETEHAHCVSHVLTVSQSKGMSRRHMMKGALGIAGLAVIGWGSWHTMPFLPRSMAALTADLSTQTGQVKSYQLDDGTRVWLNTHSAMNDSITKKGHRHLSLLDGEAQVKAIPSTQSSKPLNLSCSCGVIVTQQARFNIRSLSQNQAVLAVFDGEVMLAPAQSQTQQTIIAGQQVYFTSDQIGNIEPAQARYDAWTQGLLVVENMRLGDFVAELARYQVGYINLDSRVADLRIVGTFPIQKSDITLGMLEKSLPVRVQHPLPFWVNISVA